MSMEYIRDTYGVPTKRGMEITFQKCEHVKPSRGWIVGSRGHYLRVRFAGNLGIFSLHPTWNITYENEIQQADKGKRVDAGVAEVKGEGLTYPREGEMKPIKKEWCNTTIAENQPEYLPLPAHIDTDKGVVTSCWNLCFKDRVKALFYGELTVQVRTFNQPLQPIQLWFE